MSKRKLKTWYRNLPILKQLNNKGWRAKKSLIVHYRHRFKQGIIKDNKNWRIVF